MAENATDKFIEVEGTIQKIDDEFAVILLENGQKISWPRHLVPVICSPGSFIRIKISADKTNKNKNSRIEKAKNFLNSLFKNE